MGEPEPLPKAPLPPLTWGACSEWLRGEPRAGGGSGTRGGWGDDQGLMRVTCMSLAAWLYCFSER